MVSAGQGACPVPARCRAECPAEEAAHVALVGKACLHGGLKAADTGPQLRFHMVELLEQAECLW